MKKLPSPRKTAILLTILILGILIACAGFLLFSPKHSQSDRLVAEIYQGGVLIKSIPLGEVTASETFTVRGPKGEENVIEVRSGSIAVISANCPDKLCVHQGFRSDTLLPITCLPNHLVILIRPTESANDGQSDALTY